MRQVFPALLFALAATAAAAQLPTPPPAAPPPMGTVAADKDKPPPEEPSAPNSLVPGESPWVEWEKKQGQEERLRSYGPDLLGDSIDPHSGSLSFEQTDVSLPGNSHLEVAIKRRRSQGYLYGRNVNVDFGDWELVVPKISVITGGGGWVGARCSNSYATSFPPMATGQQGQQTYAFDYSSGVTVQGQSGGPQQMLEGPQGSQWPAGTKYVTSQNWKITCIDDPGQAGANDGFLAVAPNGDQYTFNRYVARAYRKMGGMTTGKSGPPRAKAVLLATQVTDVSGNTVTYSYDASNRLTQISANDGRLITLSYGNATYPNLITQVCAHGRCWQYGYAPLGYAEAWELPIGSTGIQALTSVTLPDGRSWTFDMGFMHAEPPPGPTYCASLGPVTITHPYGVVGVFDLVERNMRTSLTAFAKAVNFCPEVDGGGGVSAYPETGITYINIISVASKTLSGPGVPSATWTYAYEADTGAPGSSSSDPTNWTTVTEPGGSEITYFHRWSNASFGGQLVKKEIRQSAGGTPLETADYSWLMDAVYGTTLSFAPIGASQPVRADVSTVMRGGSTYTTDADYDINTASSTYSYGLPIQVIEGGNTTGGLTRITDTVYAHNKTAWVLGLPASVTRNNKLFDEYTYDTLGRVLTKKMFGTLRETYTYNTAASAPAGTQQGTVATFKDAHNHTWTLSNWKRGKPQTVARPIGTFSRAVNDFGEVTSETDGRGITTGFNYNNVGWMTLVDLPAPFADISTTYAIGSGVTATTTRGTKQTVISYDGMLRATQVETRALDGSATTTYERSAYDIFGKETFRSWPSFSSNPTTGVNTTYDALGRPLTVAENVPPYATTTTAYLSGAQTRVTDPSGAQVLTTTRAFGSPDGAEVMSVLDPMGATTATTRDIYGNVTQLTQSGNYNGFNSSVTRNFWYDANLRLCRHRAPEFASDEVFLYDAEGLLTDSARGESAAGACPGSIGATNKVTRSYDALHRETSLTFPSGGGTAITRTYDGNGNVLTVYRGSAPGPRWTYQYTALNAISQEKLEIDSRTYQFDYGYDTTGNLSTRTGTHTGVGTAHNVALSYDPDALGRPRKAAVGTTNYISGGSYHPNGLMAGATFLNGKVFFQNLDARQKPLTLSAYTPGGSTATLLTYDYDARGKVISIIDGAVAGENRTFGYDLNGRLTSSTGPWGSGSYVYDPLSNIRSRSEGTSGASTINYASNNRVSSATVNGTARTYTYDARGNTTSIGATGFAYDYANQPVTVTGTGAATFAYDGNFKRVKEVRAGKTTYTIYSRVTGSLLHRDQATDAIKTEYASAGGASFRLKKTGTAAAVPEYIHADHLGSPIAATDASGAVTWRESYRPFGKAVRILGSAPANDNNTGFTGHLEDDASGLVYMQARYYDPLVPRFLSADPIGYQDQPNLYAYVHNEPVNMVDPNGEETRFAIREHQRNLRLLNGEITPEEFRAEQVAEGQGALMGLAAISVADEAVGLAALGRAAIGSAVTRASASRGFAQAGKFIRETTEGFAKTGGRSGRTTFQSFGSGGQKGAEKLFDALTKGKSEALENGGRLGNLGDGAKVQISTERGVTSVRITQQTVTTGSRIPRPETIKVRFKENE